MNALQLNFFDETSDSFEKMERRMEEIADSSDKVRRGIYAKHAELAKKYMELHERMNVIERNLCQS